MLTLLHEELEESLTFQFTREKKKISDTNYSDSNFTREFVKYRPKKAFEKIEVAYTEFFFQPWVEGILSHYHRNLYHIFKFIHTSNLIETKDRQFYATIVRSQLSPDELFLLFYNCMIPGLGNPKCLFLVKEYELMDNFNYDIIKDYSNNWEVFLLMKESMKQNPFIEDRVEPTRI